MKVSISGLRVRNVLLILSGLALSSSIFGNGCSKSGGFTSSTELSSTAVPIAQDAGGGTDSNTEGAGVGAQCKSVSDYDVIPGAKTASVVGSTQILKQLTSCVGLVKPSDNTTRVYNDKKGSVSTYGGPTSITAPMMMSIVSISGEVCSDLIDQEIASGGRIFVGIDLTSSQLPSNASLSTTINNLALSCWRGNEEPEEKAVLLEMINSSVGASEAGASRKAALMICTAMLSSLNTLLN
jgi:hypothetical protein